MRTPLNVVAKQEVQKQASLEDDVQGRSWQQFSSNRKVAEVEAWEGWLF